MKYVLVTGGVCSGIGKGILASSIGALLKSCNIKVTSIKIDPYLNRDAGLFSPHEHGEVYVLDDGSEVDLDLGNYERFLDVRLKHSNNITLGKINQLVGDRERKGYYLGKTVQKVPHVTDAIQEWIEKTARGDDKDDEPEVCIIELGGTIDDMEGDEFFEALRQLQTSIPKENFCSCLLSYVLRIGPSKQLKSKPTQKAVRDLRRLGIFPDVIVCRGEVPMTDEIRDKISRYCGVNFDDVISFPDLPNIYKAPTVLQSQGIIEAIGRCLNINARPSDLLKWWSRISEIAINAKKEITIALVGKYSNFEESYTSVIASLEHACYQLGSKPLIRYIDSSKLEGLPDESKAWRDLTSSDCLLVPGGFGLRGTDGKINAINWARCNKLPFLGICLGFQLAVIEYARNVLSILSAHSEEFKDDMNSEGDLDLFVIEMLEYLDPERKLGGTMRLGRRPTRFVVDDSILRELYNNQDTIYERHRHRYEINPDRVKQLEKAGLRFVGRNDDGTRMEILELDRDVHPYFVAVQYHPEYLSRPFKPSPPYLGLVRAGKQRAESIH